jgi:hypothetical protein
LTHEPGARPVVKVRPDGHVALQRLLPLRQGKKSSVISNQLSVRTEN